jgi:hypothetical protein
MAEEGFVSTFNNNHEAAFRLTEEGCQLTFAEDLEAARNANNVNARGGAAG